MDALTIPHMALGVGVVGRAKLNVRADPVLSAPILGQLAPMEAVTIWALADGWAIVQNSSGLTGWTDAQYLTPGELVA